MGGTPTNSQAPQWRDDIYRQLGIVDEEDTTA